MLNEGNEVYLLNRGTRKNLIDSYKAQGFKIVTCGHKYDLNFMNRQRTLFELADASMSNDIGTHVGYSIALNKPHYIYKQKIETFYDNGAIEKKHTDNITQESSSSYLNAREEIYKAFNLSNLIITDKQIKVIEKYWGNIHPLSLEEIRSVIL